MKRGVMVHTRGAARARVAQREVVAPWVLGVLTAMGVAVFGFSVAHSQPVPEVVRPHTDSPTLPPSGADSGSTARPRSENPLADSGSARPIPDRGVIAPPVSNAGSTPVIRPPSVGTMPVIPPPGSAGGDRSVVPK